MWTLSGSRVPPAQGRPRPALLRSALSGSVFGSSRRPSGSAPTCVSGRRGRCGPGPC